MIGKFDFDIKFENDKVSFELKGKTKDLLSLSEVIDDLSYEKPEFEIGAGKF